MYRIIFKDGTEISDLELNGNCFISETEITEDMFKNKLNDVTIEADGQQEVHKHMKLELIWQDQDKYLFIINDVSDEELEKIKIRSDIDYIAMMTDVEL